MRWRFVQTDTVRVTSLDPSGQRISLSRLDQRGAVIGSDDAVDNDVIDGALKSGLSGLGTNLGDLLRKAQQKPKG